MKIGLEMGTKKTEFQGEKKAKGIYVATPENKVSEMKGICPFHIGKCGVLKAKEGKESLV